MNKNIGLLFCLLCFSISIQAAINEKGKEKSDFLVGADLSMLKKIEEYGGVFKVDGKKENALDIFKHHGFNYVRIRLFHSPNMEGATCQSLPYVMQLARQVKDAGMKVLLDFHYSDTWADPAHQRKPKAWSGLSLKVLKDSVYSYTLGVMNALAENELTPDMVQVGNEITFGMLWPEGRLSGKTEEARTKQWNQFADLLRQGIKAVKDSPKGKRIPIMIHIANGGQTEYTKKFYNEILKRKIPFDLIGQSYYPWWHGTMEMLEENIQSISQNFKKGIVIVETGYPWQGEYRKGAKFSHYQPFPVSEEGQADFLKELYLLCRKYPAVKGLFYWSPEFVKTDQSSGVPYKSRSLFEPDGEILDGIKAWQD